MAKHLVKRKGDKPSKVVPAGLPYDSSQFVVLDIGHALIKAATDNEWTWFPHAFKQLDEAEWNNAMLRGEKDNPDYVRINDIPFVFGQTAQQEGWPGRQNGANRYTREYYGYLSMCALFRVFHTSRSQLRVFATHAPEYINYRNDIKHSLAGTWKVQSCGQSRVFQINEKNVHCIDEPLAGAMNVMLTLDGGAYQHEDLRQGVGLVIDIGGYTINTVMLRDGRPMRFESDPDRGIQSALDDFRRALRQRYPREFKSASRVDEERVIGAFENGFYYSGGVGKLDCEHESAMHKNVIVGSTRDLYTRYGGAASVDYIIMTGGGCGLLHEELKDMLAHPHVYLADKRERIHLANAFGALKTMHFYKRQGAF